VEKGSRFWLSLSARAGVSTDEGCSCGGPALHYWVAFEAVVHGGARLEVGASNDVAAGNSSIKVA
jgi:hypothetical protein